VIRIIRPGRNVRGVSSHADGSKEESQEEGRQEEDEEGEKEEVSSVDSVNVVAFGGSRLTTGTAVSEGKGRGLNAFALPRPSPSLQPRRVRGFLLPS
jgi:hypothetical protein